MVGRIYQPELQSDKANASDTDVPFLDLLQDLFLHLSISDGFVSSKIYDKRDDFDFDILNFSFFFDGDVLRSTSYGAYISQLIRFARGWLGGAMVLGKLPVLGRPSNLANSRARAYCACSGCGCGLFGHFYSHLSFLSSFSLSLGDGPI